MADKLIGKSKGGSDFTAHPAGSFAMVCVDVVDLGDKVQSFQGKDARIVPECALVFASGRKHDNGDLVLVTGWYTLSMHEKAKLRHHLESWRGAPYSERQVRDGVPIDKLEGQPALVMLSHRTSAAGRLYAQIEAIGPLPEGMQPPVIEGYQRPDFFAERKKKNFIEVGRFERDLEAEIPDPVDLAIADPASDLPF